MNSIIDFPHGLNHTVSKSEGYDVSIGGDTNILSYTDVADLSEYAIPAMQWAVGAGIINGTGDGSILTPQGPGHPHPGGGDAHAVL